MKNQCRRFSLGMLVFYRLFPGFLTRKYSDKSAYSRANKARFACGMVPALLLFFCLCLAATAGAGEDWVGAGKSLLKRIGNQENSTATGTLSRLSEGEIGAGLKEALRVGSESVVARLGSVDGFNADSLIHIPLPEKLEKVKQALGRLGLSGMLNDLELRLNRAAEAATPPAKELFARAITDLTLEDVQRIYKGPEDAATQYFRQAMTPDLSTAMTPVVNDSLAEVGAIKAYDEVMAKYRSLPLVPDVKADLSEYVVGKGLDGIFLYLAKEEAAIRSEPVKQTTALLKKVFGQ